MPGAAPAASTTRRRQVREVRLVRREGRSSVCLVLLRFESQRWADDFFRDFNGKPVSRWRRIEQEAVGVGQETGGPVRRGAACASGY